MNKTQTIKEGMGGFHGFNGDRYPFTVIEVISDNKIIIQEDDYKVTEKDSAFKEGPLQCNFYRNPQGHITVLTRRKNGRWVPKGMPMKTGWAWVIGERAYSRNPHF